MKLMAHMIEETINPEPREAPPYIMWVPPSGAAVECPSLETAQRAAVKASGRSPGMMVGVYQLVGFAYKPIEEPDFVVSGPDNRPALQKHMLTLDAARQADDSIQVPEE